MNSIWLFHGERSQFASGVFTSIENAEAWMNLHKLSGVLTLYPINIGVYDWAIQNEFFVVHKEQQQTPQFIQGFTTASQEHYHYCDGKRDE